MNKPPLGLKPKHIHEQDRIWSIVSAISRYTLAEINIPQEWIDEYNELVCDKEANALIN